MFVFNVVLIGFAISPAVSSAVRNLASISTCSASEFTCLDGTCISADAVCDNYWDCPGGSDEASCYSSSNSNRNATESHERFKRQASCGSVTGCTTEQCTYLDQNMIRESKRPYKWQCADGTCIAADGRCDGKVDCPDRSDETHALCRNIKCQTNLFRCTYGACVDGTAPCNNINECADESDELLPRCRNENRLSNGKFRCLDGNTTSASDHCDGIRNCPDGSDETVRACAGLTCPTHLFQCAYGACVDQGADCNGRKECADGSDESVEMCNRMLPANTLTTKPTVSGQCVLPPYPEHGTYVVANALDATPGLSLPYADLNITCDPGYGVAGDASAYCFDGNWRIEVQNCVPFCRLDLDASVQYKCEVKNTNGYRICNQAEPSGTLVNPECNENYELTDQFGFMKCLSDGRWNRIVKCKPVCGRVTPIGVGQVSGGTVALRAELPWHVAIYLKPTKEKNYYSQICGGSMVSDRIVISAAHCFWDAVKGEKKDASNFAVATAKLFREWNHKEDPDAQTSELRSLDLAPHYLHSRTNYQHDIAVLTLKTPFKYFNYVRPVCLDFDYFFNTRQLQGGTLGKVAGWGLTTKDGPASPVLKVVQLPVIPFKNCTELTPETFTQHITADKICAGYNNGTAAVCLGDSGGGLSFPEDERGKRRYYLRGIVSTAPVSEHECNTDSVTTFTEIYQHKDFINKFL